MNTKSQDQMNAVVSDVEELVAEEGLDSLPLDTKQFVTFVAGNEVFAVDMLPVQEIIRVPETVRVPLAPASLDGLSNLRGKVLPIVSLRKIFGFDEQAYDDATRALVIDIGQPLGFVVDRVSSVIEVENSKIEGVENLRSTVNIELLSGIIKDVGGHAMIMVLDFSKLIEQEFEEIARVAKNTTLKSDSFNMETKNLESEEDVSDELQLVSFDVAVQEYAIAIEDVQEIVQVPDQIIHVPHSDAHVLGVMMLRNRLLPLVSLRQMFGLPSLESNENSRIVVVALGSASVGVVMDNVNEVLRVSKSNVDAMPSLLIREGELADITEICRLDNGKRLVSIISAQNLFNHTSIKEALRSVDEMQDQEQDISATELADDMTDDEQMVVFLLNKEEFGVPIESVQEIVRVPEELTHVPKAPSFVEGVINLRGAVLPVIDLRRRLGLESVDRNDGQRVMVFLIAGVRTGFIVDSVAEVLRVNKSTIEPAPKLSADQARLLARMANLEKQKRMVQLIDPSYLLEGQDLAQLAKLAA